MSEKKEDHFDLHEAVDTISTDMKLPKDQVRNTILAFLNEFSDALADGRRVNLHNYFNVSLKVRNPRSGVTQGKAWTTPKRLEPEFQAHKKLREDIEAGQGLPCI